MTKKRLSSGVVQLQYVTDTKLDMSRSFRKNMTEAEKLLWSQIRGKRCNGLKFRRQQVIDGFIADFFCAAANLVIEVDGPYHDNRKQKAYDARRRNVFALRGIREIRFWNEEVIDCMEYVLNTIVSACGTTGITGDVPGS